jgi:hypothetical protein
MPHHELAQTEAKRTAIARLMSSFLPHRTKKEPAFTTLR